MSKIDVSKCKFYCEKYDGCYCFNSSNEVYAVNPNEHNSCEANKDCYYKELQQLKAELQAYKDKVKPVNFVDSDEYLKVVIENKQLKAENEKLCTAISNELHGQYKKCISSAESDILWGVLDRNATQSEFCKKVIYETRNYITKLKGENDKYKQCLDEIEKTANTLECDCAVRDILQKIKEVKGDE